MWLDLVCERLIPYRNISEVPIEVSILLSCIMDRVYINVGEIIADQFKQRTKQQATTLSFPNLANSVITLATKTDKEAPVMKQEKHTGNRTPPPPSASTHASATSLHTDEFHCPPPDLLNIAQRNKMHESQLVRLTKAIPSIIQISIKKTLQPAKDKLTSLFSTVDVLESEVGTLRQEVAALSARHPLATQPHVNLKQCPRSPKHPKIRRIIGGWDMQ
ncbi:hypothetical protein HAX54_053467, partial [Datura stramonium]|nr:hypothetical protein [Datura stramonium]